jgi:hypothetical protein
VALQFRRGTAADRANGAFVPANGEPIFETDTQKLYIGDGATTGGINFLNSYSIEDLNNVNPSSVAIKNPSSYAIASEVVTITFDVNHGFNSSDQIVIANSSVSALDGTHTLTSANATDIVFTLTGASDVTSTALTADINKTIPDGNVLTWDSAASKWIDSPVATDVASLSDVNLTSLSDQEILRYNSTSSKWENQTLSITTNLAGLTDVNLTSLADGEVLIYNNAASEWQNQSIAGSGLGARSTANESTASIADLDSDDIEITGFKSYMLMAIETSAAAWVVVYTSDAARTADSSRNVSTDPLPGSGVIAEVITNGAVTQKITPGALGFNDESPVTTDIYLKVQNLSGATASITVTLTLLNLEA